LVSVLLEVLVEEAAELGDLGVEVCGSLPGLGWVEELVWYTRACLGHLEVEGLVCLVLGLCKLTGVNGVKDGASVLEWATLAASGGTGTDPTGVEQPSVGVVTGDLVRKHSCVSHGVKGEERLSEAR